MQCLPVIGGPSSPLQKMISSPSTCNFLRGLQKISTAWFYSLNPIGFAAMMEAFDNVESQTTERYYNNYITTNGLLKYRYAVLGKWTVDVKLRIMFLTDEPGNFLMMRIVVRGTNHIRPRRSGERHSGSLKVSFTLRDMNFKPG